MVIDCLEAYKDLNGQYPENIVLFRDGVGESQIDEMIQTETKQLKKAFREIRMDYAPHLAQVLVNKRINNKFFSMGKNNKTPSNP